MQKRGGFFSRNTRNTRGEGKSIANCSSLIRYFPVAFWALRILSTFSTFLHGLTKFQATFICIPVCASQLRERGFDRKKKQNIIHGHLKRRKDESHDKKRSTLQSFHCGFLNTDFSHAAGFICGEGRLP